MNYIIFIQKSHQLLQDYTTVRATIADKIRKTPYSIISHEKVSQEFEIVILFALAGERKKEYNTHLQNQGD